MNAVFFYGMYMDFEHLMAKKVKPKEPQVAFLKGWEIAFCPQATITQSPVNVVYGITCLISPADVKKLYGSPEMKSYISQKVEVENLDGEKIVVDCYIKELKETAAPPDEYFSRLLRIAKGNNFPSTYLNNLMMRRAQG